MEFKRCRTLVEGGVGGPHEGIVADVEFGDYSRTPRIHSGALIRVRRNGRDTWIPLARVISIEVVQTDD